LPSYDIHVMIIILRDFFLIIKTEIIQWWDGQLRHTRRTHTHTAPPPALHTWVPHHCMPRLHRHLLPTFHMPFHTTSHLCPRFGLNASGPFAICRLYARFISRSLPLAFIRLRLPAYTTMPTLLHTLHHVPLPHSHLTVTAYLVTHTPYAHFAHRCHRARYTPAGLLRTRTARITGNTDCVFPPRATGAVLASGLPCCTPTILHAALPTRYAAFCTHSHFTLHCTTTPHALTTCATSPSSHYCAHSARAYPYTHGQEEKESGGVGGGKHLLHVWFWWFANTLPTHVRVSLLMLVPFIYIL